VTYRRIYTLTRRLLYQTFHEGVEIDAEDAEIPLQRSTSFEKTVSGGVRQGGPWFLYVRHIEDLSWDLRGRTLDE